MPKYAIYIILLLSIALYACKKEIQKFSDEKLAEIVADVHIAETSMGRYLPEERDSLFRLYIEQIEIIHDAPYEDWKIEIEEMQKDPERFSRVYEIVINRIQDIEKETKRKTQKTDNIKAQ